MNTPICCMHQFFPTIEIIVYDTVIIAEVLTCSSLLFRVRNTGWLKMWALTALNLSRSWGKIEVIALFSLYILFLMDILSFYCIFTLLTYVLKSDVNPYELILSIHQYCQNPPPYIRIIPEIHYNTTPVTIMHIQTEILPYL